MSNRETTDIVKKKMQILRSGLNPTTEFLWKIYDQRDGKNKV
jgi:predicted secreted protein